MDEVLRLFGKTVLRVWEILAVTGVKLHRLRVKDLAAELGKHPECCACRLYGRTGRTEHKKTVFLAENAEIAEDAEGKGRERHLAPAASQLRVRSKITSGSTLSSMSFIYIGDGKMLSMKNELILEKVASILGESDHLVAAYLFGSRANGDYRPGSDVDIGVLFEEELGLARVVRIEQALEEAIGLPVDVLDLRRASAFLALDIVRGIRILCNEETLCDEFELFVLSRAGDLAFFERQRRAVLLGKEV